MPGRACQERKAERRKAKFEAAKAEEPPAKRYKIDPASVASGQLWYKVPPLAQCSDEEIEQRMRLCTAVASALVEYDRDRSGVGVGILSSHFKVQTIKKEPCFSKMRLADIIESHSEYFQVNRVDPHCGKWIVKLRPGAQELLVTFEEEQPGSEFLPASIEEAYDRESALQAVRIEVIQSLHKRGGAAQLNDIGQEPHLNKHRHRWLKDVRFVDIVKQFPSNFMVTDQGHGNFFIELGDIDVSDAPHTSGLPTKKPSSQSTKGGSKGGCPDSKGFTKGGSKSGSKGSSKVGMAQLPTRPTRHLPLPLPLPVSRAPMSVPVSRAPVSTAPVGRFCGDCGNLHGGRNFCEYCGAPTGVGQALAGLNVDPFSHEDPFTMMHALSRQGSGGKSRGKGKGKVR